CGSSREHAPWAIEDAGFKAIIAPSFADIFRSNCTKIGLLPVALPTATVATLMRAVEADPKIEITVDLDSQTVKAPGVEASFDFDPFTRWRLLEGLDDIALTERHAGEIDAFEKTRPTWAPVTRA